VTEPQQTCLCAADPAPPWSTACGTFGQARPLPRTATPITRS